VDDDRQGHVEDDRRMFAPYCTTCGSRRLLGLGRIVVSEWERGGTVRVRCDCGDVIDADAQPPGEELRTS
jgi:hypothetical protein